MALELSTELTTDPKKLLEGLNKATEIMKSTGQKWGNYLNSSFNVDALAKTVKKKLSTDTASLLRDIKRQVKATEKSIAGVKYPRNSIDYYKELVKLGGLTKEQFDSIQPSLIILEERQKTLITDLQNVVTKLRSVPKNSPEYNSLIEQFHRLREAIQATGLSTERLGLDMRHIQASFKQSRAQTGIIAAQFQDIAVTAYGGMSPYLIALQQGTQLQYLFSQTAGGAVGVFKSLGGAIKSVLSPMSIMTVAITGFVAAAIQSDKIGGAMKGLFTGVGASIGRMGDNLAQTTINLTGATIATIALGKALLSTTLSSGVTIGSKLVAVFAKFNKVLLASIVLTKKLAVALFALVAAHPIIAAISVALVGVGFVVKRVMEQNVTATEKFNNALKDTVKTMSQQSLFGFRFAIGLVNLLNPFIDNWVLSIKKIREQYNQSGEDVVSFWRKLTRDTTGASSIRKITKDVASLVKERQGLYKLKDSQDFFDFDLAKSYLEKTKDINQENINAKLKILDLLNDQLFYETQINNLKNIDSNRKEIYTLERELELLEKLSSNSLLAFKNISFVRDHAELLMKSAYTGVPIDDEQLKQFKKLMDLVGQKDEALNVIGIQNETAVLRTKIEAYKELLALGEKSDVAKGIVDRINSANWEHLVEPTKEYLLLLKEFEGLFSDSSDGNKIFEPLDSLRQSIAMQRERIALFSRLKEVKAGILSIDAAGNVIAKASLDIQKEFGFNTELSSQKLTEYIQLFKDNNNLQLEANFTYQKDELQNQIALINQLKNEGLGVGDIAQIVTELSNVSGDKLAEFLAKAKDLITLKSQLSGLLYEGGDAALQTARDALYLEQEKKNVLDFIKQNKVDILNIDTILPQLAASSLQIAKQYGENTEEYKNRLLELLEINQQLYTPPPPFKGGDDALQAARDTLSLEKEKKEILEHVKQNKIEIFNIDSILQQLATANLEIEKQYGANTEKSRQKLEELLEVYRQIQEEQRLLAEGGAEVAKSLFESLADALKEMASKFRDLKSQIVGIFSGAFSELEDSFVNMITEFKIDFKNLVDFLIKEIARIAVQQAILAPLASAFSGFFSSLGSSIGGNIFEQPAAAGDSPVAGSPPMISASYFTPSPVPVVLEPISPPNNSKINELSQPPNMSVEIINRGSQEIAVQSVEKQIDARQVVTRIILEDLAVNGQISQALKA